MPQGRMRLENDEVRPCSAALRLFQRVYRRLSFPHRGVPSWRWMTTVQQHTRAGGVTQQEGSPFRPAVLRTTTTEHHRILLMTQGHSTRSFLRLGSRFVRPDSVCSVTATSQPRSRLSWASGKKIMTVTARCTCLLA